MKKKLLSIILVAMLSTNAIPYAAVAAEEGTTAASEEAAEDGKTLVPQITDINMEYKKYELEAEVVEENGDYSVRELVCKITDFRGKDVHFEAETEAEKVGDNHYRVCLRNCHLTGSDAELFRLRNTDQDGNGAVILDVYSVTHIVHVAPDPPRVRVGEDMPGSIDCHCVDESADIDSNVNFSCTVNAPSGKAVEGTYSYNAPTADRRGYEVSFDKNYSLTVENPAPDEKAAKVLPVGVEKLRGVTQRTISCPDGFEISTDMWNYSKSVTLDLDTNSKGTKKTICYFVRKSGSVFASQLYYNYILNDSTDVNTVWADAGTVGAVRGGEIDVREDAVIKLLISRSDDTALSSLKLTAKSNNKGSEYVCRTPMISEEELSELVRKAAGAKNTIAELMTAPVEEGGTLRVGYGGKVYFYAEIPLDKVNPEQSCKYTDLKLVLENEGEKEKENISLQLAPSSDEAASAAQLLVDKKLPVIANSSANKAVAVSFSNTGKSINGIINVADNESGIKEVKYKWDFEDDYTTIKNVDSATGKQQELKFSASYSELDDDEASQESFVINVQVTDNAGNVTDYSQECMSEWDQQPPAVKFAGFVDWDYNLTTLRNCPHGNYTNSFKKLFMIIQDDTDKKFISGFGRVELEGRSVTPRLYSLSDVEGIDEILESIEPENSKFSNSQISKDAWKKIRDSIKDQKEKGKSLKTGVPGNTPVICIFEVSELSGLSPISLRFFDNGEIVNEVTANSIIEGMVNGSCVYDEKVPECSFTFNDTDGTAHRAGDGSTDYKPDTDGRVWLNENDTSLSINISDHESGIDKVIVEKLDENGQLVTTGEITVSNKTSEKTRSIVIPLHENTEEEPEEYAEALTDGKYSFNIVVYDNAGNVIGRLINDENSSVEPVRVDVGVYTGSVTAESQSIAGTSKYIKNQLWMTDTEHPKLKIKLSDNYAGIGKLLVTVNDKEVRWSYDKKSGTLTSELIAEKDGSRVSFDGRQQYKVVINGSDNARHIINLSQTVNADTKAPEVYKVEAVKKSDNIAIQTLNFFTFGAFSNDVVEVRAYIKEPQYDSGLSQVILNYNKADGTAAESVAMDSASTNGGDHIYTALLPIEDQVFYNDISIYAEDNVGKKNDRFVFDISGGETESRNCLVIEKNEPVIGIDFPESDLTTSAEEIAEETEEATENESGYAHHISNYGGDKAPEDLWYAEHKKFAVTVQDAQAGINSIKMTLNGVEIEELDRFRAGAAEKAEGTEAENATPDAGNEKAEEAETGELRFEFDTEELHKILEKQPERGDYKFTVEAVDNAGNATKPLEFAYNLDDICPEIEKFIFSPATSDNVGETEEWVIDENIPTYTYFFGGKFWAVFRVSDAYPTSELDRVDYRIIPFENGSAGYDKVQNGSLNIHSDTKDLEEGSEEYSLLESLLKAGEESGRSTDESGIYGYAWLEIPVDFKGQIFGCVFDKVGHSSESLTTHGYVTDNNAPTLEITGIDNTRNSDGEGNKLYSSEKEVTVVIRDTQSGLRNVNYSVNSEKRHNDGGNFDIRDFDLNGTDEITDGWTVSGRDSNLITEIRKTFVFDSDDNGITITASAGDNSGNHSDDTVSEKFTVDLTEPVIDVDINGGIDGTNYYSAQHKPEITIKVTERNFDPELISTTLQNSFGSKVPAVSFTNVSDTEHTAHLVFDEGDFTFDIRGRDMAGHSAKVNMDRSKIGKFYMDNTAPVVSSNLTDFADNKTGNYLSSAKNIEITVVEHNFDPERSGLKIWHKDPGSEHDNTGFTDVTSSVISRADWKNENDTHTLSAQLRNDGVYKIEVAPSDPSGNNAGSSSSGIFELDTTKPVVTEKNGKRVDKSNADKFLDIYNASRKDEAVPTVEFADANFDHLKYVLTVYAPQYKNGRELAVIRPKNMFLPDDKNETGTIKNTRFALPEFDKDGVYALELIAVDKAGNESYLNSNTYMRLVDNDVLAYIPNSSSVKKTGWYSFQYDNGDPISKRPDNFSDIEIVVFSEKNSDVNVVLRDFNGDEKVTDLRSETDPSLYGVNISRFTLGSDYFKNNFRDDTDTELYLSVKNDDARIDLGRLHIDNIEPKCDLPKSLKSWKWFAGNKSRTITVSNIDEQLDMTNCKVYDNGREIDFDYSPESKSLSFKLDKGWHRVGVKLEDEAGNVYSIQEIDNLYVGYFWLWVILGSVAAIGGLAAFIIAKIRRKRLY
ncbi:Ig-like domain repeat protein [Ruminococcus sp.]|mgnify:CR=1 FL=1|uniref:Ig-like domain repeat protein n=1 Tax=Ruminococcus sp. TaxID=41978 RepID=UPI002C32DE8D|nr:Ig-like domain repeat protein [Ruminococcus sp.]HNZ99231.1 Ig-like domain repeat protein [Ruminococcus sp.]